MDTLNSLEKSHYVKYIPELRKTDDGDESADMFDIKIDIKGLDIVNLENVQSLLTISTNTFKKIERLGHGPLVWHAIFGVSNMFLSTLSKEDQEKFVRHLMTLHNDILEFTKNKDMENFSEFIAEKAIDVQKNEESMNLCEKISIFAERTIPLNKDKDVGNGSQHTEEFTFYRRHVLQLLTITLLSKLYGPISGLIMSIIKGPVDCKLKEMHASALFKEVLKFRYQALVDKLSKYLKNQINKVFEENYSTIFFAWTPNKLADYIFSSLLVRNFINVNLLDKDGDIMVYTVVTCRKIIKSKYREACKSPVQPRLQYANSNNSEDSAIAQMELVSSYKTCDVVPIINTYIDTCCNKYMLQYDIKIDNYNSTLAYFKYHKVVPTTFNKFIACGLFGHDIGGGRGLLMLHQEEYTKLITILVLVCFNQGYYNLGHMASSRISDKLKLTPTVADNMLSLNFASNFAYTNCKTMYDQRCTGSTGKEWDRRMEKLVAHLTKFNYVYNTPNELWDGLNLPNLNGKVIANDHGLFEQLCSFIELLICSTASIDDN